MARADITTSAEVSASPANRTEAKKLAAPCACHRQRRERGTVRLAGPFPPHLVLAHRVDGTCTLGCAYQPGRNHASGAVTTVTMYVDTTLTRRDGRRAFVSEPRARRDFFHSHGFANIARVAVTTVERRASWTAPHQGRRKWSILPFPPLSRDGHTSRQTKVAICAARDC